MAVPVGFEPTVGFHPHNFSRVAPSAARTRYRGLFYWTGAATANRARYSAGMRSLHPALAVGGAVAACVAGVAVWSLIARKRESIRLGKIRLNETLPVHSKWWRDAAHDDGEILYAAIGDSAAQGIGASAPKNSYVGVIADHIREATGRTVRVVNLSISGATVGLAVADQLPAFSRHKPDIVTVSIGANDIAAFDPVVFRSGIEQVLDALPSDAIVADLPYFYFPKNERKVAIANEIIRHAAAERGLQVAPLHESMRRHRLRGILTHFAADLFHPNDHGYRVWASAFLPAVIELATRKFPRPMPSATPSPTASTA